MNPAEEANAYQIVLNRKMEHGGSGRTGYKFIVDAQNEVAAQRNAVNALIESLNQKVSEMNTIINQLSSRPTAEEYAKVQAQVADKVAEITATQAQLEAERLKIKIETVYTHDAETKGMISSIYNYFVGQFKTFQKYKKKD